MHRAVLQALDGICSWDNFRVYDFPPPTMKQACETVRLKHGSFRPCASGGLTQR